jgi:hypothetical protein
MKLFSGILCVVITASAISSLACAGERPESMEARIDGGEVRAFIDAADLGRKDLIPAIERHAGDEPWARAALAKLGVRKYLDEILLEATGPTNHLVHGENAKYPVSTPSKHDRLLVQMDAFKKLAYIKNRSTVKILAAFLYVVENPDDYHESEVFFPLPSEKAMEILPTIVDNPPIINLPAISETHDARVKAWQQWWEKNKDKYP